ncbi:unnamed protein product [Calypogeia fissa]
MSRVFGCDGNSLRAVVSAAAGGGCLQGRRVYFYHVELFSLFPMRDGAPFEWFSGTRTGLGTANGGDPQRTKECGYAVYCDWNRSGTLGWDFWFRTCYLEYQIWDGVLPWILSNARVHYGTERPFAYGATKVVIRKVNEIGGFCGLVHVAHPEVDDLRGREEAVDE